MVALGPLWARWESWQQRFRWAVRRLLGVPVRPRIHPYLGWGTPHQVRIRARVLEHRPLPNPKLARGLFGGIWASVLRYRTAEIPGVQVQIHCNGHRIVEASTDDEGFVDVTCALDSSGGPGPLTPGWHNVLLSTRLGKREHTIPCQVWVAALDPSVEPSAQGRAQIRAPLVISDIDDTIIDTHVTSRLSRARSLFLGEITKRPPFVDVAQAYQALAGGRPVFYVSSSPVNVHDHLTHWLEHHQMPRGPLLLRDWGPSMQGFAPDGTHGHKQQKVEGILHSLPVQSFILVGDSGQEDPVIYQQIVQNNPGRIAGVAIRKVPSKPHRVAVLNEIRIQWPKTYPDIPFLLFEHSRELLRFVDQIHPNTNPGTVAT